MGYVVIYGSQIGDDLNIGVLTSYGDLDSAKRCCLENISEDFGYDSVEEFLEEFGLDYEKENDKHNPVYEIGRYDGDNHEEKYEVYKMEI